MRAPSAFVSHGAPTLALDRAAGAEFAAFARSFAQPRAILVISAHWERTPVTVGTPAGGPLIHDYSGFPPELNRLRYPAPGAPELADLLVSQLHAQSAPDRRWDHGVWVPLLHMFPAADVPLVQISLPSHLPGSELVALGRALAPLRDEGVMILGSGGMVHNLGALDWSGSAPPPPWALEFEAWARAALSAGDFAQLADFRAAAPALQRAHPTLEHFLPLLVAAGAAGGHEPVRFPIDGYEYGSLCRLAAQFG